MIRITNLSNRNNVALAAFLLFVFYSALHPVHWAVYDALTQRFLETKGESRHQLAERKRQEQQQLAERERLEQAKRERERRSVFEAEEQKREEEERISRERREAESLAAQEVKRLEDERIVREEAIRKERELAIIKDELNAIRLTAEVIGKKEYNEIVGMYRKVGPLLLKMLREDGQSYEKIVRLEGCNAFFDTSQEEMESCVAGVLEDKSGRFSEEEKLFDVLALVSPLEKWNTFDIYACLHYMLVKSALENRRRCDFDNINDMLNTTHSTLRHWIKKRLSFEAQQSLLTKTKDTLRRVNELQSKIE